MIGFYITEAHFRTKKTHSNKDNEYKLENVSVSRINRIPQVEIYLDDHFLGYVPYSDKNKIKVIDAKSNKIDIRFSIDTPENLENTSFKYSMKMYPLFGKEFKIEQGNVEH